MNVIMHNIAYVDICIPGATITNATISVFSNTITCVNPLNLFDQDCLINVNAHLLVENLPQDGAASVQFP